MNKENNEDCQEECPTEFPESWRWTKRYKEVVVKRDYLRYRYFGGCPGQLGRRLVNRFGQRVDEKVEYYKGHGWMTVSEKQKRLRK